MSKQPSRANDQVVGQDVPDRSFPTRLGLPTCVYWTKDALFVVGDRSFPVEDVRRRKVDQLGSIFQARLGDQGSPLVVHGERPVPGILAKVWVIDCSTINDHGRPDVLDHGGDLDDVRHVDLGMPEGEHPVRSKWGRLELGD